MGVVTTKGGANKEDEKGMLLQKEFSFSLRVERYFQEAMGCMKNLPTSHPIVVKDGTYFQGTHLIQRRD